MDSERDGQLEKRTVGEVTSERDRKWERDRQSVIERDGKSVCERESEVREMDRGKDGH